MRSVRHSMPFLALALAATVLATQTAAAGTIEGRIRFAGKAPAPRPITITKDQAVCGKEPHLEDSLLVGPDGAVKNVVVSLVDPKDAPPMPAPPSHVAIDQHGCRFVPRITLVPAGAPVDVVNSDGILHNIHTWSKINPPFNRAQPKFKKVMTTSFAKPEVFRISCDVHSWMQGWVVVAANAFYALSDEKGAYRIPDVPAGTYTVRFWHERLGMKTKTVTVPASGSARLDFTYPAK